ncbi:site-specific DNA-methyltransferase [Acidithiobacillus ferrooxidans]|uniref:site-specific DNA-methyltransferase n=1 Tax=Acidithiobacillus ferrooxidans TaxID=920 RepID=UPI0015DC390B|nr:site-specific DNA-methyltransferase [Acidithiobacillus ferrooxidans]MCR1341867.1 site-specific DNA-methyltransferase [Acidithiobacillus ferrooxidans]QLK42575.1 site-specific DNA-methyltransferase [Acidithiobacillus ferrooxidans]QZT51658.1 site-specific DNA-methyltransferase [Acidithiobacillus ferrooxidans]BDB15021.1 site-specific DNA-methyltransferase [Acidithiobacillus ferrooxidans]
MYNNDKLNLQSLNIPEEKREELLRIFPEVRTEGGQIDFDRLRLALGDMVDTGKERYGLNWPGKSACFKAIQTPSMGTLLPAPEESINFDTTENLIIEGDNLEALKLLQKSYIGKVKMIYIDPPYNTGNDFIYPDNFSESLQTYLEYTGQTGEEGKRFSSNTDTDGRFHSKWLNMMYPRLYLARDLLRDDGVIFISIDDNEMPSLRLLCDYVFGEENFIGSFVWRRRASSALADRLVSTDHEYVIAIQKSNFISRGIPKEFGGYSNPDNDFRGEWISGDLTVGMGKNLRPNQFYDLINPATGKSYPPNPNRVWAYIRESMDKLIAEDRVIFPDDVGRRPMLKRFRNELKSDVNPASTWLDTVGLNTESTKELQDIFGQNPFDYSKPLTLIKHLLKISADAKDIILDFFAGSGTTAHAVLDLNKQDGGNRKFILVQLPEPTDRTDYPTIADITKERVRRVIKKLNDEDGNEKNQDRGFRVFKLAESNFTPWDGSIDQSPEALSKQIEMHIEHVRQGRTDEDILYEILLKSGFPLSIPVETLQVDGKTVYSIHDGIMLVCLDRNLTMPSVQAIVDRLPERVVFLDEGFAGNDALKVNAKEACKLKNIVFKVV